MADKDLRACADAMAGLIAWLADESVIKDERVLIAMRDVLTRYRKITK